MGNQLLTPANAPAAGAVAPQSHDHMPEPTYNTLIELLDSAAADEKNQSKWHWMDENGRETNSCTPTNTIFLFAVELLAIFLHNICQFRKRKFTPVNYIDS